MIDNETAPAALLYHVRFGTGRPLVLLHGLGGSWRSWMPVINDLAAEREVIAVDLPGFGETPALPGPVSVAALADAVTGFLHEQRLIGADIAGSSLGARLALELARRGVAGAVVALDPGGFWQGWERTYFRLTIRASVLLVRVLRPLLPLLTGNAVTRSLLFAQFSARPWDLSSALARGELQSFAHSPAFDALLDALAAGPAQAGLADVTPRPIVIVWGLQDRVCLPRQAKRAADLFPHAKLIRLDSCGHFPQWDLPQRTARIILSATD